MSDSLAKVYGFEITDQHLPVKKPPSFIITRPDMVPLNNKPVSRAFWDQADVNCTTRLEPDVE